MMETSEADARAHKLDDGSHLVRNRSLKTKQLVRSQALRETHSPPRVVSPAACDDALTSERDGGAHSVEIQITPGNQEDSSSQQRLRANRWLGRTHTDTELLSHSPRVTCVCAHCTHCRCKRRERSCPIKQDSGIACSEDCPDCSDTDQSGGSNNDSLVKSDSVEADLNENSYCRYTDRKEKPKNISLSRADSDDKSDLTGAELISFIKATLNKNVRDRMMLIRIEKELHALVTDNSRCIVRFPVMSSYGRMLVHRCAALFQLSHHLDTANKGCVLVSKIGTSGGRIPCTSFKQWCSASFPTQSQADSTQAKSILKRSAHSLDEPGAGERNSNSTKSLEQRERDYETLRTRIFSSDNCAQDESWPWLCGPVKLLTPDSARNKLLKVHSLETYNPNSSNWRERGPVSKSNSFGGYGGDSGPRLLSRQGDLASSSWRLSPSSSGYKTLSMRSTDSVPPSPTGVASPEPGGGAGGGGQVVWCVSDLASVPPGALIIHPETGRPITNADGSVYRFDAARPPPALATVANEDNAHDTDKIDQNNEKRRGRLEKQHSFIDNECECPTADDYQNSCCCKYSPSEEAVCSSGIEKPLQQPEQKLASLPPSPSNSAVVQPSIPAVQDSSQAQYEPVNSQYSTDSNESLHQQSPIAQCEEVIDNTSYMPTNYVHSYTPEHEITSPQQSANINYLQSEVSVKSPAHQAHDQNLRAMATQAVSYQNAATIPQYACANQMHPCPVDTTYPPPLYQPVVNVEEQKLTHPQDTGFRIDPSYQMCLSSSADTFGCTSHCAPTCHLDTTQMHRSGHMYGAALETAAPVYPLANVLLQHQYPLPQYQQLQWQPTNVQPILTTATIPSNCATPLQKPPTPPNLYLPQEIPIYPPPIYNQQVYPILPYTYNYPIIPQIPQNYPTICQNIYPLVDQERRNSSRNTPLDVAATVEEIKTVPYERDNKRYVKPVKDQAEISRQNSQELALKIQQIKEKMAAMNVEGRERDRDRDRGRGRRNNGTGILGSYGGAGRGQTHGGPVSDERQLTSAARVIAHSLRHMQYKHNYHNDNQRRSFDQQTSQQKQEYQHPRTENYQKPENYQNSRNRQQKPETHIRPQSADNQSVQEAERPRYYSNNGNYYSNRMDHGFAPRNRTSNPVHPFQYRQPYNVLRQMAPGTWCRRSPAPGPPAFNAARRPPPDYRPRRQ